MRIAADRVDLGHDWPQFTGDRRCTAGGASAIDDVTRVRTALRIGLTHLRWVITARMCSGESRIASSVMPVPHVVARFNKRVTNRFIEPIARISSGFAVVHHFGRRSGSAYATPVNLFQLDDRSIVALTYGPSADWVQNVLEGGGTVEHRSNDLRIDAAEIVDRGDAWPALPLPVRLALRILRVREFMKMTLAPVPSG